ncbi:MAG: yxlF 5 [Clostridiales bacterium]|nr:yxlF 5 [Clostridiales bacterium]
MDVLKIEHLSKKFGEHEVINDLSFSVPEHSVFGFLGQNGAGKTTTMKMILGLLKATSGKITVCGEEVNYGETKTNSFIGYLPDVPEFYNYMTPKEYLKLCGEITGLSNKQIKQKSSELLELVGLTNVNRKIGGFSRGMKQRLGIAQA